MTAPPWPKLARLWLPLAAAALIGLAVLLGVCAARLYWKLYRGNGDKRMTQTVIERRRSGAWTAPRRYPYVKQGGLGRLPQRGLWLHRPAVRPAHVQDPGAAPLPLRPA